jgi:hypothetical protein
VVRVDAYATGRVLTDSVYYGEGCKRGVDVEARDLKRWTKSENAGIYRKGESPSSWSYLSLLMDLSSRRHDADLSQDGHSAPMKGEDEFWT